jgi:hypothetical protein
MRDQSTKALAESAVSDLNAKAERLGWARRFELRPGSNANGVRHSMDVILPELAHPAGNIKLGSTYREALIHLGAMNEVLNQALAERKMARDAVLSAWAAPMNGRNEVNRSADEEESFPIHPLLRWPADS